MKKFVSFFLSLAFAGSTFAQMSGYSSSQSDDVAIGQNPYIVRDGIALGNHYVLSGHAHVGFYTSDLDGGSSSPMDDLMNKESGFWAYADLDSQINFDPVTLNIHTNLSDAIFVEQLYLHFDIADSFSIDAGKFVSHRTLRAEEANERFLRSMTYYNSEGNLGNVINSGLQQGYEKVFNDLLTGFASSFDAADPTANISDLLSDLAPIYEALGLDLSALDDLQTDLAGAGTIGEVMTITNEAMTELTAGLEGAMAKMISDMALVRGNYRSSYNKGIRGNLNIGVVNFSAAITESLWNGMPDMGDGNVALDLQAVAYIHPSFAIKTGYAFEKVDKVGGIVGLVIPNSDDNIHQFHLGGELAIGGFTGMLEFGDTSINPYDTDIWDIALTLHYQFTDMFGLGILYSHEDLETPFGDGDSDLFNIALNFNFTQNLIFGVDYTTADSKIGGAKTDYDLFTVNTLYSF